MDYIEALKLPKLLTNISKKVLVEGAYYGLLLEVTKDKFSIIDLSSAYCRSRLYDGEGNDSDNTNDGTGNNNDTKNSGSLGGGGGGCNSGMSALALMLSGLVFFGKKQ